MSTVTLNNLILVTLFTLISIIYLDWVRIERDQFKFFRDKNNDNVLDREEISNWILPYDFDHTLNEAKHLIYEADENQVN